MDGCGKSQPRGEEAPDTGGGRVLGLVQDIVLLLVV